MTAIIKNYAQKIAPACQDENGNNLAYAIFRIVVSGMFFMHGAQKIFGLFGGLGPHGGTVQLGSLFWFAGLIEVAVGFLIFFGVFTRLAALFAVIEMGVAYFMVHFSHGLDPLHNGGELALLYLVSFLVMFRYGAGKLSFEKTIFKRELF